MNKRNALSAAVIAIMALCIWTFMYQLAESLPPHPSEVVAAYK